MKTLHHILLLFFFSSSYAQSSHNVSLLYNWNDTSLSLNYRDSRYNDVWGMSFDGREYAVIGSTFGTHIFDVTDPANALEVDRVPGKVQGHQLNHRDFHSFGKYLYGVCDQGDGSLQIIDLNYLPDSASLVYNSDALLMRAHNVFIDTSSALLYACGTTHNDNSTYGMEVFDISNPVNPALVYTHAGNYIHDVYVINDTAYMHAANDGMLIYDFSNESNPSQIGALPSYPFQGYNHSGWLHANRKYYVFADENYGLPLKLCDVSDFNNIQVLNTFSSDITDSSVAHNIMIKGDYAYCSYYNDGFQLFNISDPSNVTKVGWYDTFPSSQKDDFRGAWGVYAFLPSGNVLISDRNTGLYVLKVDEALNVANLDESNLKIFPNPCYGIFNVSGMEVGSRLDVFDTQGKMIRSVIISKENQTQLFTNIGTGMFFVNIITEKKKIVRKLVSL
ncbi:MAG: choice-of-anchor B family protein [Flavobacteriales bacterium]|nr:choice-of-anchor B family protein [Flavobacteriales bacterium]